MGRMTLALSKPVQERIAKELASLPAIVGKVVLTVEFYCGDGGRVNEYTIKHYSEAKIKA